MNFFGRNRRGFGGEFGRAPKQSPEVETTEAAEAFQYAETAEHERQPHSIVQAGSYEYCPTGKEDDAHLSLPERAVFGVFDGVGSSSQGGDAARFLAHYLAEYASVGDQQDFISTQHEQASQWLEQTLGNLNASLAETYPDGRTTMAVGRVVWGGENDRPHLVWAAAGDSRMYCFRGGRFIQLNQDDAIGGKLTNFFGSDTEGNRTSAWQAGSHRLIDGDRILFFTDGIINDNEENSLHIDDIAQINFVWPPDEAARLMAKNAVKQDDRTAVVVEIRLKPDDADPLA